MEDLYGDLENFNDVNLVNELKSQNAELKHKLEECISSRESLQKSFDSLSAEFKILTTNYSSLLQIARSEIKRKSDMITMLNKEKDALVISHFNSGGRGRRRNYPNKAERRSPTSDFNRTECQGPPSETSSTDQSHKLTIVENRSVDNLNPLDKNVSKDNEGQRYDAFRIREEYRDDRPHSASGIDRRLSKLAGQQFAKFSSDEEFEDMYSALEPKTKVPFRDEPERGRKRNRDEPQQCRGNYDAFAPLPRYSSNPEQSRDRFDKNKNSRYYDNDNNRGKYDFPPQLHKNRISPDRHRRSRIEYGEDRYSQRYDRTRRLQSPPERGRYQHKSRERRPYLQKERVDYQNDMHKYNSSEHRTVKPSNHGEYEEPQTKRPRVETYLNPDEDRRQNDKFSGDHPDGTADMLEGSSCQSPDYMHTEHMALNLPIREIKHVAVTKLDDPRVTSRKYVKLTDGNKDILCALSSNEIDLQLLNKSLWSDTELPQALACKPVEISEELVNETYMDVDRPTTTVPAKYTNVKEVKNNRDVTEYVNNENGKENLISKPTKGERKEGEKINKTDNSDNSKILKIKFKKVNKENGVVNCEIVSKDEVDTNKGYGENVETKGFLDKFSSASDSSINSEVVGTNESSTLTENKDVLRFANTLITENATGSKNEPETLVSVQREFEHKIYSTRHIVEGDLELSDETNDDTRVQTRINEVEDSHRKHKTKHKSKKDCSKEKKLEANSKRTRPKKDKVKDEKSKNKFSELFGDSSSLITPEDLELATTQAHAVARGDSYMPECEDAQDGINNKENHMKLEIQTPQNEILKSNESKLPNINMTFPESSSSEKNNSTEVAQDILSNTHNKSELTEHVVATHCSTKDLKKSVSTNATQHGEKSNILEENTSSERSEETQNINREEKSQDGEKTSMFNKKVQSVKKTKHEKTSKSVKKTHNDGKQCKSVKNTQDEEKSGKTAKKTRNDDKSTKSVKKIQDGEKTNKIVKKPQDDEKTNKSIKKTQNDEKSAKSVIKIQNDEVKKPLDDEKSNESLVKKIENDHTSEHVKEPREDKITKEIDASNKKNKSNEESEVLTETRIDRNHSISETKRTLDTSSNKENTSYTDISKQDMNSDMPQIFDDTLVPSKNYVDNYKANEEKVVEHIKPKESTCVTRIEEIPNLAPVIDDPGVQVFVISRGSQPSNSNLVQLNTKESHYTPLKALATSTPAKELFTPKPFSEIELNGHQPGCVNEQLPNEDSSSQREADVPDVRINYYRRRKRVLKQ